MFSFVWIKKYLQIQFVQNYYDFLKKIFLASTIAYISIRLLSGFYMLIQINKSGQSTKISFFLLTDMNTKLFNTL